MKNLGQIKQSDLTFKFLIFATLIFIVLVGFLFWQQTEVPTNAVVDEQTVVRFSDRDKSSSVTDIYLYGARYIHDIEAYPQIKDLFFISNFPQLTNKNKIAEALAEIEVEKTKQDEFGKTHVYSTSYYIGNLLISPNLTLHAVLAGGGKPDTSILLDSALSDVRSGVVKIQNFFDVAPPFYYDEDYVGATYFSTASFPSLTVAEAGIVLYLLAEIDPVNARLYEQFLHQYANQVLASGANFYIDIEYSLKLASAYFSIIKESPDYKKLLQLAKAEWEETAKHSLVNYFEVKFPLSNFPYESRFAILPPTNKLYKSANTKEKFAGEIMLSLVDNRLPDPAGKLYAYNLTDNSLLPFAVDLQGRRFPALGDVVVNFAGLSQDKYFFISGTKPRASEVGTFFGSESQIHYRENNEVKSLSNSEDETTKVIQKGLELSLGQDRLLYNQFIWEQKSNPDSWEIRLDKLSQSRLLKSEVITRGSGPVWVHPQETVLFWREGEVWQIDTNSGDEQRLIKSVEKNRVLQNMDLDYLEDTQTLAVSQTYIDPETLTVKTELSLHKIEKSPANILIAKKVYEFEINDAKIFSIKQSPGGNYLGMLVNETIGERNPRLLIFDINNGIIIKELDLEPYSIKSMSIDDWLSIE